ncbi:hypothetical protein, conserved [Babesia bigemina]|uniref:Uncharacterized protein n=1 Tax=Babesia bigemina TaxID=5866 RepID=A0A061DEH6_BABBI|nr:hypothetical protein, conserved [Babesia bigemina]CDR97295.1 hypothetical protein, conserved [Babesia bigemina]|eukprot:XP_012769481.1 hypothetical protein, conserved [Babesia bigemina]
MSSSKSLEVEKAPEPSELVRPDGSYLSHLVEDMLQEMGVSHYDNRTTHLLSLSLLDDAQQQSENRISQEKQRLLQNSTIAAKLPKLSVTVSEEDAQLACQQYLSRHVGKSSFLQDIKEMQRYANSVRLGVKTITLPPSKQSRGFLAALRSSDVLQGSNIGVLPHRLAAAPPREHLAQHPGR